MSDDEKEFEAYIKNRKPTLEGAWEAVAREAWFEALEHARKPKKTKEGMIICSVCGTGLGMD